MAEGGQKDLSIKIVIDNQSVKNLIKDIKSTKFNIPTKEISDFSNTVDSLEQLLKLHSKTMDQLVNQIKQINVKIPQGGISQNAQARVIASENKLKEKQIYQDTMRDKFAADAKAQHDDHIFKQEQQREKRKDDFFKKMAENQQLGIKNNAKLQQIQEKLKIENEKTRRQDLKDLHKSELEVLIQEGRYKTAEKVKERVQFTHDLNIKRLERNQELQLQKKQMNAMANAFSEIFTKIKLPGAEYLGQKASSKYSQYQTRMNDAFLYQKNIQKFKSMRIGSMEDTSAQRKYAEELGITDLGKAKGDTSKMSGKKGALMKLAGKALTNPLALFAGGAAVGVISKMISIGIESSPIFQQMVKLMKFGFMLIFKPIGDFFGMIMRPVMIMLLRKFIIPNYQKLMPVMLKMGDNIGKILSSWLFTDAFKNLWSNFTFTYDPDIDPFFGTSGVFTKLAQDINNVDWDNILPEIDWTPISAINEKLETTWTTITDWFTGLSIPQTVEDAWISFTGWFEGLKIPQLVSEAWTSFTGWFEGLKISETITTAWDNVMGWFKGLNIPTEISDFGQLILDKISGFPDWISTKIKDAIGLVDVWDKVKDFGQWIKDSVWNALAEIDFLQSLKDIGSWIYNAIVEALDALNPFNWIKDWNKGGGSGSNSKQSIPGHRGHAFGGIINEPVIGIGASGKTYSFAEHGSERVIPNSQINKYGGAISVTININKMSGDERDIRLLRRTILDVLQDVNYKRGLV